MRAKKVQMYISKEALSLYRSQPSKWSQPLQLTQCYLKEGMWPPSLLLYRFSYWLKYQISSIGVLKFYIYSFQHVFVYFHKIIIVLLKQVVPYNERKDMFTFAKSGV